MVANHNLKTRITTFSKYSHVISSIFHDYLPVVPLINQNTRYWIFTKNW